MNQRYRLSLACGTALAAVMGLAASPASAQQAATGQTTKTGTVAVEELVVTGSRIPRANLEQPTPISVLSEALIDNSGPASLGDIISNLPQVGFTGTLRANSNNFANGAGIASIDLRNLGLSRTLVLVDGQRHVAGDLFSNAVDVNSIPTALVDRVEVVTGGASAIYGSDAVSGVVNIILKKKFEGIQVDAQIGSYDNFGAKYNASVTAGRNFLDGRLNVAVTGYYTKERGIFARSVPGSNDYGTITNPADLKPGGFDPTFYSSGSPINNNGIPNRIYVPHVGSDLVTPNGVLLDAFSFSPQFSFNAQGRLVPVPQRTGFNSFAFAQLPGDCQDCYFGEDYTQEASPFESKGLAFNANWDFTDHLRGFLDAKAGQTDTENVVQPSFSFGDFQLQPDNAFITPELKAGLAGIDPADYPFIGKFLNAGRTQSIERRTYRVVAGLAGDFDARFAQINWDASLNYGETNAKFTNSSLEITENFNAALDSVIDPKTGKPACRINVPTAPQTGFGADAANKGACVPYNPFGQLNGPDVFAYSFGSFDTKDKLTQQVATLNANFDSSRFFNLQGGPVGFAVGAEYRKEHTKETNDQALLDGLTENLASNSSGGYDVKEAYAEVSFPIFKDFATGLSELSVDAAYRGADYSTVGKVGAYKFSGTYGPLSWIKLRTTYSRAIRAPNITEAFSPSSSGFFNITDPCSTENINANVNYAKNCQSAGVPAGFKANTNASIIGESSGNPNLDPEKSISYTGGIVIQPPMVPGLSITVDYYSIKIKNAITLVSAQDIINNCYSSSAGLDPNFCPLSTRDAASHNINFVSTTYVNASKLFTDGLAFQIDYSHDVSPLTSRWHVTEGLDGRFSMNLNVDYLYHLRNFPFQANPSQVHILEGTNNNVADEGTPHLRGLANFTYNQGPATVNWTVRYIGKGALFNRDSTATVHSEALNVPFTEPTFTHNIAVRYQLSGGWREGAEVFAGINNVFGEEIPFTVIGTGGDIGYDIGRFFFAGFRYRR